jgi:hypothetical protein
LVIYVAEDAEDAEGIDPIRGRTVREVARGGKSTIGK